MTSQQADQEVSREIESNENPQDNRYAWLAGIGAGGLVLSSVGLSAALITESEGYYAPSSVAILGATAVMSLGGYLHHKRRQD